MGWGITGTLLSGIVVWGGVGLLLDRWWGTRFVALIGVLLGLTAAIYLVVVKYGAVPPPPGGDGSAKRDGPGPDRTQKG
jgi:F0F1-type ATP synthase assembly protein I